MLKKFNIEYESKCNMNQNVTCHNDLLFYIINTLTLTSEKLFLTILRAYHVLCT